jgi:hypothetical protein
MKKSDEYKMRALAAREMLIEARRKDEITTITLLNLRIEALEAEARYWWNFETSGAPRCTFTFDNRPKPDQSSEARQDDQPLPHDCEAV